MAEERTIKLNVDTKDGQKNFNDLEEAVEGVNNEVKETTSSTEAMSGTLDKVTGGAVSKFKAFKGSLKGVIGSFKTLRGAIISTGIGALVITITSLIAAFKDSEEGQNKFAKIMGVIGAVVGNVGDLLADLGEGIISVFEDPKQAILDFKDLIVTNITNRFNAILDTVGFLGSAIKSVFKGDFDEALESAKKAGSSFVDSFTGVENSIDKATESTKRFIEEQKREIGQAAKVADMRAKADKIERQLIIDRSKLESEIANLRLKSRQEGEFSAAERKKALLDAQKLEEELLDKETQFLELRRDAQILENTFSRSNKENLTKEAEAIAAVNRQQAARANAARQVQREVNTISKQIEAENKRITNEEKAEDKALAEFKKTLRDAEAVSEQEKRDLELIKIQEHYDDLIEQAKANNIKTDKLEDARDEAKRLKQEEFDKKDAERNKKIVEETKKLNEELAQAETNLQQAKANAIRGGLQVIGMLAGKSKGVAKTLLVVEKGLAIAQVISNAARAIAQAKANLAATPAVIGLVPNPAYIIQAAATAKGILSTKLTAATSIATIAAQAVAGLGGGGGGGGASVGGLGGAGGGAATQPQAPSFNIVGATETSQLAEAVGSQTQQPVQAYVVSNDITTAQSLENNIVEGATL